MSGPRASTQGSGHIGERQEAWDEAVLSGHGHLLQSWRWGEFKNRFGWETERVAVSRPGGVALAQILFRHKAGVSIGYIPRGPVVAGNDTEVWPELWTKIDQVARRRRALTVILEPDLELPQELRGRPRLDSGPPPIQPSRTVKIELADDNSILKQMHQKTRYNVRLAQRRGVTTSVAALSDTSIADFYRLMEDTSSRNDFSIHSESYYREFLRLFGPDAALIFAEVEAHPVVGIVVATFGTEAIYMYGASSTKDRAHGAGFLIQFEAMRWSREHGCRHYDLWGIPRTDPETTHVDGGDRIAGTKGNDWRGLYEFKTRFGGSIVNYSEPLERRYHPLVLSVARRLYNPGAGE